MDNIWQSYGVKVVCFKQAVQWDTVLLKDE